jgi:hypothetical protein
MVHIYPERLFPELLRLLAPPQVEEREGFVVETVG